VKRLQVLLIGGSRAEPSRNAALLRAAERSVAVRGAATWRWDLAKRPLGAVVPGDERGGDATAISAASQAADALVLVSPLYHSSYSGALKDALDHLSARELAEKPVALLSNSGGMPSTQALDHLRIVVRALLAIAIPRQVVTVDSDYELDQDHYRISNPEIEARVGVVSDELLWMAARLRRDLADEVPHDAAPKAATARRARQPAAAGNNRRRS
jgi:azobenzene reductase